MKTLRRRFNGRKKTSTRCLVNLHGMNSVLTGRGIPISKILSQIPHHKQNLIYAAVESTVSHLALIVATNKKQFKLIKNLALSPTDNKYHEAQCILRTNDTIMECVSALLRGNNLVPVPVHDAGCEVGLHGGKWADVHNIKY